MFSRTKRGFTLIELMIVIAIIAIIAAIAIPNLLDARKAANEANAIAMLRAYHSAQGIYREQDKDGNGTLDFAQNSLQLVNAGLLNTPEAPAVAGGITYVNTGGYVLVNPGGGPPTQYIATIFTWSAYSTPQEAGDSGDRYFFIDQTGVIRYSLWAPAQQSLQSESLWPAIGK